MMETQSWIWVIEAMASFEEVSLSLLHDLVEAAPELPPGLMKSAEERVALRCLEELFACQMRHGDSSVPGSKVGLDVSESCKNVLKRMAQEGNISELKTGGSELAKFDIEPYIRHKRSNMPELDLEKLSRSIGDGTHPDSDFFRRHYGLGPINSESDNVKKAKQCASSVDPVLEPNLASASESEWREDFLDAQNDKSKLCRNTLRRKRVPWTTEEVEMIKEGIMQQSSGGRVQWKMILELGKSTFLEGQTAIDLKDKWRNMCKGKGSPKPPELI